MRPSLLLLLSLTQAACNGAIIDQPDSKPVDTDVTGNPDPDIGLSITSLNFGDLHYGDRVTTTVTVFNHGGGDLTVSAISATEPVTVNPPSLNVAPGGSSTVTIAIQPVTYAAFTDPVVFTSNDPDTPGLELPVQGVTISDEDGDGYAGIPAGGDDCDDDDATVNPGVAEEWYNNVDNDCSGGSDWDQDQDGYESDIHNANPESGGGDCQDINADYHPGAEDAPYDGADTDCGGGDDYDQDADGYRSSDFGAGSDCDDYDASVNTEGTETWNGKDDDCDGVIDGAALPTGAPWRFPGAGAYDRAGYSVALADLDEDGWAEVIIGAYGSGASSPTGSGRGGVGVFYSNTLAPTDTAVDDAENWFRGDSSGDQMGAYVSAMGDYDGDGGLDVAISATGTNSSAGVVYLISGADLMVGGDHGDALLTVSGGTGTYVGRGIGTDLDLDGDGAQDLVVGYVGGGFNYVGIDYGGSSRGSLALTNMDATFATDGNEAQFYRNMGVGGDYDGDGTQDLILCDGNSDAGAAGGGALWALWGSDTRYASAGDTIGTWATVLVAGAASEHKAWACQLGEDITGDGYADLWIYNQGDGLYAVSGGPSRTSAFEPSVAAAVAYNWHSSSGDAEVMRGIGDWTGDGLPELGVYMDDGAYGAVNVFPSELASGTWEQRDARIADVSGTSEEPSGNFGYGFSPKPGDVDGDGDMDVAVGDPEYDGNRGALYLFTNSLE